jgi:hypothetical protein
VNLYIPQKICHGHSDGKSFEYGKFLKHSLQQGYTAGSEVATASSGHYMSTRDQLLSNLFAAGDGRASFQKWGNFGTAKRVAVRISDWPGLQMESRICRWPPARRMDVHDCAGLQFSDYHGSFWRWSVFCLSLVGLQPIGRYRSRCKTHGWVPSQSLRWNSDGADDCKLLAG